MRRGIVIGLSLAVSACTAGRYVGPLPYEGELGRVIAANLALTCPGSVYLGPPVNTCLDRLPVAAIVGASCERPERPNGGVKLFVVRNPTTYVAEIFDGRKCLVHLGPNSEARIRQPGGLLTARVKIPDGGRLREAVVEMRSAGGTAWEVPAM